MSVTDPSLPLAHVDPIQHAWAHRKWSWADEQGWLKLLHIPYACLRVGWTKDPANPLWEPSGWETPNGVGAPSVVKYGGYYYMIYVGNGGVTGPGGSQIGIRRSTNKTSWTPSADNPIIRIGDQAWMNNYLHYPYLTVNPVSGLFELWFTGMNVAGVWAIGYASCPLTSDPMVRANWTLYAGNPVETSGHTLAGMVKVGNVYYMVTGPVAATSLHLRFSSSPTGPFTYYGQILGLGSAGQWDDAYVYFSTLFWNLGIYYLLYSGMRAGGNYEIGMALAGSDGTSYVKLFNNLGNPVLGRGAAGAWDATHVVSPSLIMEDKSFFMWYVGYGAVAGVSRYRIGLAKLNLDF